MTIKRKTADAVIVPKHFIHYDPATFADQKAPQFLEVSAEELLAQIRPMEFDFLPGRRIIAVDTETYFTGVPSNSMPANVVRRCIHISQSKTIPNDFPFCISICDGTHSFVVYDTLQNGFAEFHKLMPLLMDMSIDKVGQNFDFDLHMLANTGTNMRGRFYDTLHLSKLTRAGAFTHSLIDIATEIHDDVEYPTITKYEHMLDSFKAAHRITDYRQIPRELMTQYTGADTWNTIYSFKKLYPMMLENKQFALFEKESEIMLVTFHMERSGIPTDIERLNTLIPELRAEVDEAERKIYEDAGYTFNINSSKQLAEVLIKLGYRNKIHYGKPTDAMLEKGITQGNPSFDKIEMERLENEGVPLIADILQFRKSEKLLNTFAIKLYDLRDANDVVHCNINTIEAKTGRFSISDPSMQNIPRRKDARIREAFVAPDGYTFYDFDFKAQESLIMAHYSRAPYLLDNINAGKDIHKVIAAIIYSLEIDNVTKALRDIAKSIEFAIVYGAGPPKIVSMTIDVVIDGKKGLTLEEARMAIATFKKMVPEVEVFIKTANKVIKERGCIKTIMGRFVYAERGREYACVNYLCQGSAADSTKSRMTEIYKFLKANGYSSYMVLQVHDSLLQAIKKGEEELLGYLKWLQTERELFRVTVNVDVAICEPTWRAKSDVDVEEVRPPQEMLDKMNAYDIWAEGILA